MHSHRVPGAVGRSAVDEARSVRHGHVERIAASVPYWRGDVVRGSGAYPNVDRWFEAFEARVEELHSRDDRAERERRPAVVVGVSTAAASVLVGSEDVALRALALTSHKRSVTSEFVGYISLESLAVPILIVPVLLVMASFGWTSFRTAAC